jgi:hypothetical protein
MFSIGVKNIQAKPSSNGAKEIFLSQTLAKENPPPVPAQFSKPESTNNNNTMSIAFIEALNKLAAAAKNAIHIPLPQTKFDNAYCSSSDTSAPMDFEYTN